MEGLTPLSPIDYFSGRLVSIIGVFDAVKLIDRGLIVIIRWLVKCNQRCPSTGKLGVRPPVSSLSVLEGALECLLDISERLLEETDYASAIFTLVLMRPTLTTFIIVRGL